MNHRHWDELGMYSTGIIAVSKKPSWVDSLDRVHSLQVGGEIERKCSKREECDLKITYSGKLNVLLEMQCAPQLNDHGMAKGFYWAAKPPPKPGR